MNAISREAIRQQKETFEQLRRQDRQWFTLRLIIGYSAVLLPPVVLVFCAAILLHAPAYPESVVKAVIGVLLTDVIALFAAVRKVVLSPRFDDRLRPVTHPPERPNTMASNELIKGTDSSCLPES